MPTIDKLDIDVYNLYAIRSKMVEQINQQFHLEEAGSIPPQTNMVNATIQLSELELLLGIYSMHTPWAYFFPPKKFYTLRRSPFSFSRIAPTLGTFEEQEEDFQKLQSIECESPDEEKDKATITNCFKEISKLNGWLGFIVGRIGQFLQG
jgi:hypothetical protein